METDDSIANTITLNDDVVTNNHQIVQLDGSCMGEYNSTDYSSLCGTDTITITGSTSYNTPINITQSNYGSITYSQPSYSIGTVGVKGISNTVSSVNIGYIDQSKQKIYIVEPWQSNNPINVDGGMWISLEKDLISYDQLKRKIFDKLEETNPDILVKIGLNQNNIQLVKREVNLEINMESGEKNGN